MMNRVIFLYYNRHGRAWTKHAGVIDPANLERLNRQLSCACIGTRVDAKVMSHYIPRCAVLYKMMH